MDNWPSKTYAVVPAISNPLFGRSREVTHLVLVGVICIAKYDLKLEGKEEVVSRREVSYEEGASHRDYCPRRC